MCLNEPMLVFDKERACLYSLSRGHCDTVWYVESYKGLVLNSICKINSPRGRTTVKIPISLLRSSCPLRFLHFSLVNVPSLFQSHSIHTLSLCTPPPIHLRHISELTKYCLEVNVVARGPAGGRCSLGTGSVPWGQRLGVMGVVGTVLRECGCVSAHYVSGPVLAPTSFLSLFCHCIPSCLL